MSQVCPRYVSTLEKDGMTWTSPKARAIKRFWQIWSSSSDNNNKFKRFIHDFYSQDNLTQGFITVRGSIKDIAIMMESQSERKC